MSVLLENSSICSETPSKKRFKITSASRNEKIGVVATKVSEVLDKGRCKLQARQSTSGDPKLTEDPEKEENGTETQHNKVVLEEDGTEVDEDDYLQSLPEDTLLMLLRDGETWQGTYSAMPDELDSACERLPKGFALLNKILERPEIVFSMKEDDLEEAASYDLQTQVLGGKHSAEEIEEVQEACLRFLQDKRDAQEALGLLHLLRKTQTIPES